VEENLSLNRVTLGNWTKGSISKSWHNSWRWRVKH